MKEKSKYIFLMFLIITFLTVGNISYSEEIEDGISNNNISIVEIIGKALENNTITVLINKRTIKSFENGKDNNREIDMLKNTANKSEVKINVSLSNRGHTVSRNLYLPEKFTWEEPNMEKLSDYLEGRNSEFIHNNRLEIVNEVAKEYDISLYLLIAITGAEQSYVPRSSSSHKIIKNPYNVYHSWQDYGVSLEKSTEIVCKTVLNLMKGYSREYGDPYHYLNKKYAEDPNWHKNLRSIHNEILSVCE